MPLWQTKTGCGPARIANDVAAVADPETGVAVYDSYPFDGYRGSEVAGGTSVSSPVIASVYALAGPPAEVTALRARRLDAAGRTQGTAGEIFGSTFEFPSPYGRAPWRLFSTSTNRLPGRWISLRAGVPAC
jgi:subtilase family serine protease